MEKFYNFILLFKNFILNNLFKIIIAIIIILLFKLLSSAFAYILLKIFNFKKEKKEIKENGLYKPLTRFFVLLGVYLALIMFKLPPVAFSIITKAFRICTILFITKGLSNLFNYDSKTFKKIREKLHFKSTDTSLNFISKIIKALIYIISAFIIVSEFGYNLGGLITGLGISSVVVALAVQDIAKSVFAGLSILSERPFTVGDYIEVNGVSGTVENISIRSTKIRNAENQLIILPNSTLVATNIINISKIEKRKLSMKITLDINTPLNKVADLTNKIKNYLNKLPNVIKDSSRVHFDTISDNGIDISIFLYTDITNFGSFLDFKENINYEILNLITQEKIELAYPSQSIYLKKG